VNGSSHVLFALSRDRYAPAKVGDLHGSPGVPRNATFVTFTIGVALLIIGAVLWGSPVTALGYLSGLATFGALISYGLVVIASLREYWTADVALRRWDRIGVPAIGLVVLGWVLYGNIYPVPAAPVKFFPYIASGYFLIAMGFSVAYRRTIAAGDVFLGSPAPAPSMAEAPNPAV
jgi:amino acid transporter